MGGRRESPGLPGSRRAVRIVEDHAAIVRSLFRHYLEGRKRDAAISNARR